MYDVTFFTNARMNEFWDMVSGLLKFSSPSVLIFVAITMAGILLTVVIRAFKSSSKDDSDKDYDIHYYD